MQISLSFFIEREGSAQDVKLKIKRIGRESCKPDKKDVAWTGSHYSLHFIREGKGVLKLGEDETPLKEGMCFVLFSSNTVGNMFATWQVTTMWTNLVLRIGVF